MLVLLIAVVLGIGGYFQAEHHRKNFGFSPWNLPSWAWALIWAAGLIIGAFAWVIAVRTTKPPHPGTVHSGTVDPGTVHPSVAATPVSHANTAAVGIASPDTSAPRAVATTGAAPWEQQEVAAFVPSASVAAVAAASPPAGWYADPSGPGHRYWDGAAWTAHTQGATL